MVYLAAYNYLKTNSWQYLMINLAIRGALFCWTGSAADICKAAMLDCDADLKCRGLDAKLLLQIHDELVWEVADPDLQQTARESLI